MSRFLYISHPSYGDTVFAVSRLGTESRFAVSRLGTRTTYTTTQGTLDRTVTRVSSISGL